MTEYARQYQQLILLPPPASRQKFASIMAHAAVLIGNSSSGIIEAMSVGLPVVNIGDRQRGREHLACLINADYDRDNIRHAIEKALHDLDYRHRIAEFTSKFAEQDTDAAVVNFLRNLDLSASTGSKPFYYLTKLTDNDR
jgi:GDP/UDP-N,N'-diacetylbacillosamine 2-epimerase (hydrolysing)